MDVQTPDQPVLHDHADHLDRPVVFLHGYLESSAIWSEALTLCAEREVPAAAVALPGHFPCPLDRRSVRRAARQDRITDHVADEVARAFPGQPVRLVGHSTGGLLALRLALRHPDRISHLMLVGALAQAHRGRLRRALVKALERRAIGPALSRALVGLWLAHPALFRAGIASVCVAPPKMSLDAMKADLSRSDPVALRYMLLWLMRQRIGQDDLARIGQPVLSVLGTGDRVVPARHQIDVLESLPNARAVLLDSGHLPMLERPEIFLRVLDGWLAETGPSALARLLR